MKRRFHVLHGEIHLSPERASTVITVCAILHNLCKRRNIPQPDDDDEDDDDHDDDGDEHDNKFGRVKQSGLAVRVYFQQKGEERQGVHKEGELEEEELGEEVQPEEEELGEEVQPEEEELGEEVQLAEDGLSS
ncbi:hypothetical protein N1851_008119 [Merluccius polli]|uniref:Nuclease HARBI1 n=1 Tax=Merluccius polli TaxID=89951 RepID=A0AA47N350_MERPO|nr:hypothetical protein N1851_008119 [Merluccius polli]